MLVVVINRAGQVGLVLAMGLLASEWTAQIPALRIPGMGEKENPTVC